MDKGERTVRVMKKVAFIICYNNDRFVEECIKYISCLRIPYGVETEIITIAGADSMAAGYNAAMHGSDAVYKVYLHQDVFIVNENFIQEIIDIFEQYPEYGMLGVLGSTGMIPDARYLMRWDVGIIYLDDSLRQGVHEKRDPEQLQEVEAIDGMIMITRYDLEWREDVFDGFDFYDVSQSMEFKKAGYKVGVPCQNDIWCNHVCGHSKLEQYEVYRERFCEEYKKEGYSFKPDTEIAEEILKKQEVQKRIPLIEAAMETGEWEQAGSLLENTMGFYIYHTQICDLYVIHKAVQTEIRGNIRNGFYQKGAAVKELREKYLKYKFLLKRLEYGKPIDDMEPLLWQIAESTDRELSAEKAIAGHTVANRIRVIWKLKWELQSLSGKVCTVRFGDETPVGPGQEDRDKIRNVCLSLQQIIEKLEKTKQALKAEDTCLYARLILETMEDLVRETHWGEVGEELYMTYFDCSEKDRDITIFLILCQEWIRRTLDYFENGSVS